MEACEACRVVSKNRPIENVPRCQYGWFQQNRRKGGVKLYAAQAEWTVVVTIMRFVLVRVCRIEPLSGQQNNQEQIMHRSPPSCHIIFAGGLLRWCHIGVGF